MTAVEEIQPGILAPRYDLAPEEMQLATKLFLAEHVPRDGTQFACYRIDGNDPAADIGRTIEASVFEGAFEGNNSDMMHQEYGPYEAASSFFINFDVAEQKPVGVLRVIRDSAAGLKTLNDLSDGHVKSTKGKPVSSSIASFQDRYGVEELDDCWDLATIAVMPEYRDNQGSAANASVQLILATYLAAVQSKVKHFVSIIDDKPFKRITRILGVPFTPLSGVPPIEYLGSPKSHAVHGYVPEFYAKLNRRYQHGIGRFIGRPLLERLVEGKHGMDESLQLFSEEEVRSLRERGQYRNGTW